MDIDYPNIETAGHTKVVNRVNPQLSDLVEMKVGLEKLVSQLFEVSFLAYSIACSYKVWRQVTESWQCCSTKQQVCSFKLELEEES
jgi:hypothetical protein